MAHESLLNSDWSDTVARLGGAAALEETARQTGAFQRSRKVACAVDLLRLTLAYGLGGQGLRLTAAWAEAAGLARLSNVALLRRLRNTPDWLEVLLGHLLMEARSTACPAAARGRLIRIVDATTVPKAGRKAKENNGVWRIHAALNLPAERFTGFELTDERAGETIDREEVVAGEIRLADRAYLQPDRLARMHAAGADFVVRAGWSNARWLDQANRPIDLIAALKAAAAHGFIDRPIFLGRKDGPPLAARLVALRLPKEAAAAAREKAIAKAKRKQRRIKDGTLIAAEWVLLVTSLPAASFTAADIGQLYRLRWRIETAFKRLKSLIGLKGPPGEDAAVAKAYVLAHLLALLLTEPLAAEFGVSPRWAPAPVPTSGAACA